MEIAATSRAFPEPVVTPKLTVVIPTYNRTVTLHAAVHSVLDDASAGIEVVIVDDASDRDDRPSPADFDDERISFIRRSVNGGVAAAQNSGLAAARAPLVCFLHSDDARLAGGMERQLDVLRSEPAAGAVESSTLRLRRGSEEVVPPQLAGIGAEALVRREVRDLHLAGWVFRTELLRAIGGFDERLRAYEDFDLLMRLLADHPIVTDTTVVARIDASGSDRLGRSPAMQAARELLLDVHHERLIERFGALPDCWRDWAVMSSVRALIEDDSSRARRQIRRSLTGRWAELPKRAPIIAASTMPAPVRRRIGQRVHRAYSDRVTTDADAAT